MRGSDVLSWFSTFVDLVVASTWVGNLVAVFEWQGHQIVVAEADSLMYPFKSLNAEKRKWQEIGLHVATGFTRLYIAYKVLTV